MMTFDRYIAIDWSGAESRLNKGIQVAEFDPANRTVSLIPSPERGSSGIWCRAEVFKQLRCWVREQRALIGFDFAFAYPYCDAGEYFPGTPKSPTDRLHLWETFDDFCRIDGNFYGGRFYRNPKSIFRHHYAYDGNTDHEWKYRYRVTDRQAKNSARVLPAKTVFKCYGKGQVGTGSLAGMRFLHRIHQGEIALIWPFEATDATRSTLVEIYPRFFLNHAANVRGNQRIEAPVKELVRHYEATLQDTPPVQGWTDDQRDALVSAAGMAWYANQQATWDAPTRAPICAATHEGWIFGVQ